MATPAPLYLVCRTDDNGNSFLVAAGLSAQDAHGLAQRLEATAHKQSYRIMSYMPGCLAQELAACGMLS